MLGDTTNEKIVFPAQVHRIDSTVRSRQKNNPATKTMMKSILSLAALVLFSVSADAFSPFGLSRTSSKASPSAMFMSDDFLQGATGERIGALVENHPVLLFMKGSKLFPQCGFSNTAICSEKRQTWLGIRACRKGANV
jgi:hypothetical protein